MSEYDALLREVATRERGEWRTTETWPRDWGVLGTELAAALRASEARAEAAEKWERAYRDAHNPAEEFSPPPNPDGSPSLTGIPVTNE